MEVLVIYADKPVKIGLLNNILIDKFQKSDSLAREKVGSSTSNTPCPDNRDLCRLQPLQTGLPNFRYGGLPPEITQHFCVPGGARWRGGGLYCIPLPLEDRGSQHK